MYNTYNMGIGMVIGVSPEDAGKAIKLLEGSWRDSICHRRDKGRGSRRNIMLKLAVTCVWRRNKPPGDH